MLNQYQSDKIEIVYIKISINNAHNDIKQIKKLFWKGIAITGKAKADVITLSYLTEKRVEINTPTIQKRNKPIHQ